MAIEEKLMGTKLMYIDRPNKFLFTKSELNKARERYERENRKLQMLNQG